MSVNNFTRSIKRELRKLEQLFICKTKLDSLPNRQKIAVADLNFKSYLESLLEINVKRTWILEGRSIQNPSNNFLTRLYIAITKLHFYN